MIWRRRRRPTIADEDAAAATVLQLAVLLQAGITPQRAWQHLAAAGDPVAADVCARVDDGAALPAAIASAGATWRHVADAWSVATAVGAPLAVSLRAVAEALRDAQSAADDVRVALAEPVATARLIAWLPLVAVALGAALGFDAVGVVFTQPLGAAAVVAGLLLMLAAHRWTARLVSRAQAPPGVPGLDAELFAVALAGGASIPRARELVTATGIAAEPGTHAVLALSRTAGAPAVELLRAAAAHARHRSRVDGRLRAARLSARLLLPLGICTLPAFLLLGVAPMILGVLAATPLSL
ncbi:type II secretion system F family protein [Microbacterium sp. zg.Y1084]|uniref:type II secretion system F family protein n=1 Tax=Microbacterium sp. zg.Y1084 TaxID=2969667 RepID=UPI00214C0E6C|nr:type II secretion system F family protein [Microbacterium sp. zg.Y1084]MCR2812762.1 type II secretion system F family protein [Microbacterium sp. zg.Y1084]